MKSRLSWVAIASFLIACSINIVPVNATTNDFVISDFQADYYLDKDIDGHSTLSTTERITAAFPEYDQNHGIERYLVSDYDGHTTNLSVKSVVNKNGEALKYSKSQKNGYVSLRIGDTNAYVHGAQTYVITYTQRDVTRFFTNTEDDEFYWDINGTGWAQPFGSVIARLHLGTNIINQVTNNQACYFGVEGSSQKCSIYQSGDVITANINDLKYNENITIVVGFKAHTFSVYKMTILDFVKQYISLISLSISFLLLIAILILKKNEGRMTYIKRSIIAQYLPPKDANIALSAAIGGDITRWVAAEYIDLAIRHKIKIIEIAKDVFKKPSYQFELISIVDLDKTDLDVVKALFGSDLKIGSIHKIDVTKSNIGFAAKFDAAMNKVGTTAKENNYYFVNKGLRKIMSFIALISVLQIVVADIIFGIEGPMIAVTVVCCIMAMIGAVVANNMSTLSSKGNELKDYLKGLKLYIKIAEQDRLRVLQSPEGADKTPIDVSNKEQLIHLYERVLPYAVLFGNEKKWSTVLVDYYGQQGIAPDWYVGSEAFNIISLGSALSNFSSVSNISSSTSASSSSSGGSGGGGFSGGGGGGGGGGGW